MSGWSCRRVGAGSTTAGTRDAPGTEPSRWPVRPRPWASRRCGASITSRPSPIGFRTPALTAKMIGTLDVISGGRMELGIGAGWKEDEWLAYGYGFPDTKTRPALLADHPEGTTRRLSPGA